MKKILLLALLLTATTAYGAWETTGNTTVTGNYIGTNNQQDFTIKTNGFERIKVKSQVNNTATNIEFPTNLVSMKIGTTVFMQSNGTITGLYGPNSFLNMKSNGANFDGGTNVNINQGAELRFYNGTTYSGFKSSPNATDTIWTLPENDTQGCLQSDGNGNLSFENTQSDYTITPNTAYTILPTDNTVEMESGDFILPEPTQSNKGESHTLINTGSGQIPVQVATGQEIGNYTTEAQYPLLSGESATFISNGNTWRVIK